MPGLARATASNPQAPAASAKATTSNGSDEQGFADGARTSPVIKVDSNLVASYSYLPPSPPKSRSSSPAAPAPATNANGPRQRRPAGGATMNGNANGGDAYGQAQQQSSSGSSPSPSSTSTIVTTALAGYPGSSGQASSSAGPQQRRGSNNATATATRGGEVQAGMLSYPIHPGSSSSASTSAHSAPASERVPGRASSRDRDGHVHVHGLNGFSGHSHADGQRSGLNNGNGNSGAASAHPFVAPTSPVNTSAHLQLQGNGNYAGPSSSGSPSIIFNRAAPGQHGAGAAGSPSSRGDYYQPHPAADKTLPRLATAVDYGPSGIHAGVTASPLSHSSSPAVVSNGSTSSNIHAHARKHSRRKSIAQAIAPSISTVRFVSYCALWYTSSALSSNTGKSILNRFKYPVTLTFVQFGFVAGWCVVFCVGRTKLAHLNVNRDTSHPHGHSRSLSVAQLYAGANSWGIKKPSRKALEGVVVMSLFQIAGHIFSSMAIARVPVSTVHTIKALSPLFTVLSYGMLFRVRYSYNTYISLLPLTLGVMLACSFDLRANAVGFLCALGSTLVFVSQNIFSKKLLPKDGESNSSSNINLDGTEKKLDKLHLLLYSSGIAFLGMIPLWAYYDGYKLILSSAPSTRTASWTTLSFFFALNGSVHFLQNLLAFSILSLTSPVTYSIASLIKRIAVIIMAIVWFRQPIYLVQGMGISLTFLGLWMYNQAKSDVARGENVRVRVERRNTMAGLLPTTKEDVVLGMGMEGSSNGNSSSTSSSSAAEKGWSVMR